MHSMFRVHFPVVLCENKYPGSVHTLVTVTCSEEFLILKKTDSFAFQIQLIFPIFSDKISGQRFSS